MDWRQAKAKSREVFANLRPTRASGFASCDDGRSVIVACHDEPVALVLANDKDLTRLRYMIDSALRRRGIEL